jgi:hypothetical protein
LVLLNGAAEDGRAPTEELSCVRGWGLLFGGAADVKDRTTAKSVESEISGKKVQ